MTKVSVTVSEAISYTISSVAKGFKAKNSGILLTVRISAVKLRINLLAHAMKTKSRIWLEEDTALEAGFINEEYLKLIPEQKDRWLKHFVVGHSFLINSDIDEEIEKKEKKLQKKAMKEQQKQAGKVQEQQDMQKAA